jgi:hypothetical protein
MAKKKRKSATSPDAKASARSTLPHDLEERLRKVWHSLGDRIEWCDSVAAWIQLFCMEARPYRETFYWEAVARMVSDYVRNHTAESPDDVLADCLIASQCPPSPGDRGVLVEFHRMWRDILRGSQEEVSALIQSDLDLARQEGTYESVRALYAADRHQWELE